MVWSLQPHTMLCYSNGCSVLSILLYSNIGCDNEIVLHQVGICQYIHNLVTVDRFLSSNSCSRSRMLSIHAISRKQKKNPIVMMRLSHCFFLLPNIYIHVHYRYNIIGIYILLYFGSRYLLHFVLALQQHLCDHFYKPSSMQW